MAGHTHLRGGALSSESSNNRAVTQTFSHESLVNRDNATGSASNISLSLSVDPNNKPGLGGSSIGWANINRASLGATVAAISPGTYTIARPDLNAAAIAALRAAERDPLVARRSASQIELSNLLGSEPPKYGGVVQNVANPGGTLTGTEGDPPAPAGPAPQGKTGPVGDPTVVYLTPTLEWQDWKARVDQLTLSVAALTSRINTSDARVLQDASTLSANPNASHQPLANVFDASRATAQLKTNAAITAAFGREAYKAVGTVADQQVKAEIQKCRDAGNADATKCTAATYWAEGGRYRTLLHAAVGGASFGAAGAAGVVVAANAQTVLGEALTRQLNAAGIYDQATINVLRSVISLAAGAAAGGAAGAASGFSVDANNRQLHPSEKDRLRTLASGNPLVEQRLSAAACFLVHCSAEFAVGTVAYEQMIKLERVGATLSAELALLRQQTDATGPMFSYTYWDRTKDTFNYANNKYSITHNVVAGLQVVGGGAGAIAGSTMIAAGAATCAPTVGAGCAGVVGGLALSLWGADQIAAGTKAIASGAPQYTLGAHLIAQVTGISPAAAELWYAIPGVMTGNGVTLAVTAETQRLGRQLAEATATYAGFVTRGLRASPEVMQSSEALRLIQEIRTGSPTLTAARVEDIAKEIIESGSTTLAGHTVAPGSMLFKVVPKGATPNDFTPYWMSQETALVVSRMSPQQTADFLGLPYSQLQSAVANGGFDMFAIAAKSGASPTVFVSTVAATAHPLLITAGGAQQIIVPNRSLWSAAVKVETVGGSAAFPRRAPGSGG